jgi:hypothetical protein
LVIIIPVLVLCVKIKGNSGVSWVSSELELELKAIMPAADSPRTKTNALPSMFFNRLVSEKGYLSATSAGNSLLKTSQET